MHCTTKLTTANIRNRDNNISHRIMLGVARHQFGLQDKGSRRDQRIGGFHPVALVELTQVRCAMGLRVVSL